MSAGLPRCLPHRGTTTSLCFGSFHKGERALLLLVCVFYIHTEFLMGLRGLHNRMGQPGSPTGWSMKESGCMGPSESAALRTSDADAGAGGDGRAAWQKEALCLCVPLKPAMCWVKPTHTSEGVFFTQSTHSNPKLFQKHPQTHPEIMFHQLPGHPLAQAS